MADNQNAQKPTAPAKLGEPPKPAPPIRANPRLDEVIEKGGPKKVPLPDWVKRLG
jgi:hypothetical protein